MAAKQLLLLAAAAFVGLVAPPAQAQGPLLVFPYYGSTHMTCSNGLWPDPWFGCCERWIFPSPWRNCLFLHPYFPTGVYRRARLRKRAERMGLYERRLDWQLRHPRLRNKPQPKGWPVAEGRRDFPQGDKGRPRGHDSASRASGRDRTGHPGGWSGRGGYSGGHSGGSSGAHSRGHSGGGHGGGHGRPR